MKVGHVRLAESSEAAAARFVALVQSFHRLEIPQYVVVADEDVARRLSACPGVDVGPVVTSPVVANCVIPPVDIVHAHDAEAAQAGLILTLTRSIPYVVNEGVCANGKRHSLLQSVQQRARAVVTLEGLDAENLLDIYRSALAAGSELPEDSDSR